MIPAASMFEGMLTGVYGIEFVQRIAHPPPLTSFLSDLAAQRNPGRVILVDDFVRVSCEQSMFGLRSVVAFSIKGLFLLYALMFHCKIFSWFMLSAVVRKQLESQLS